MRDNHAGMPEIIDAFQIDIHYFAVVEIEIERVFKKFQFGVSREGCLALRRTLQLRPFDLMPGLHYRYFYSGSGGSEKYKMNVRIELNKDATKAEIEIPKTLHANLLWFDRLKSFDEALYLEKRT
jgi:hypothetical protein